MQTVGLCSPLFSALHKTLLDRPHFATAVMKEPPTGHLTFFSFLSFFTFLSFLPKEKLFLQCGHVTSLVFFVVG